MVKLYNQISFSDIYQECKDAFQNDKPKFLELLTQHLDLSSLIPQSFYWSYYKVLGRDRKYSLLSMLAALILQKIIGIPTVTLLIIFLKLCQEAREFCGLDDVPDNSQFTRFKQDFVSELENLFNHLVDITEPICHKIDPELASTISFDTSGIEAFVTENNPKFLNSIIRKLKHFYKDKPEIDVYKMAYGLMPSCAFANNQIKQLYINGYFCYVYKFAIITNGLGIPRNITFLDDDFKAKHPEIQIDKKTDSPDEDKSISDSKALRPVLTDYAESLAKKKNIFCDMESSGIIEVSKKFTYSHQVVILKMISDYLNPENLDKEILRVYLMRQMPKIEEVINELKQIEHFFNESFTDMICLEEEKKALDIIAVNLKFSQAMKQMLFKEIKKAKYKGMEPLRILGLYTQTNVDSKKEGKKILNEITAKLNEKDRY
jgi:hypothetical protein